MSEATVTGTAAVVYTLEDVAAKLQVSTKTVRRWVDAGKFPKPLPLPGTARFVRREVDTFLNGGKLPDHEDPNHG